jgi:serine/threonine-protein kinase
MLPAELQGKYEARGTLGAGAMGTVIDAFDRMIERRVAVKLVRLPAGGDAEAAEAHARFRREAQAAGRLAHPNIVGVYEYGENADTAWIVMELVEGGTLKALMDRGERLAVPETVRVMEGVLAALSYSHGRGVVHRDIKPANIMLTADGPGGGAVKIADFGIARIESSTMTQVGTVMGTPSYMAPEQLRGEPVDARADIWAAGVVLYQLLTGEKPFDGNYTALMHRVLNSEPPPPSALGVTVPRAFDAVVARALAKRPEERFPTAAAFAEAIRGAAAGAGAAAPAFAGAGSLPGLDETLVAAPPASPRTTAPPGPVQAAPAGPARRGAIPLVLGGGAALAAAGMAAFFLLRGAPEPAPAPAPPPAQVAQAPAAPAALLAPAAPAATEPAAPPAPAPAAAPTPPPPPPGGVAAPPVGPPGGLGVLAPPSPTNPLAPAGPPAAPPAAALPPAAPPAAPPPAPPAQTTVASLPSPPAVMPAAPEPVAAPPRPDLQAAARAAAGAAPCSLLDGAATEAAVSVSGVLRRGGEAAVRRAILDRGVPDGAASLALVPFDGPYCGALDTIRQVAAGASEAPRVGIAGPLPLQRGDLLRLDVEMPDRPAHLYVSYLMKSAEIAHLVPSHPQPAGARVRLGEPRAGFPGWEVDEPFGTDMILVFASDRPLFPQPRPVVERLDDYVAALGAALRAAREAGVRVSARAVVVETVAKR